jgi:hypothetical protein
MMNVADMYRDIAHFPVVLDMQFVTKPGKAADPETFYSLADLRHNAMAVAEM